MSIPTYILWSVIIVAEFSLFILLLCRNRHKAHPTFVTYIGYCCVRSITLVCVNAHFSNRLYFWLYWAFSAVESLIVLAVMWEIGSRVFRYWRQFPQLPLRKFICISAILVAVCTYLAASTKVAYPVAYMAVCRTLERSSNVALFGVFAAMAFGSDRFGIHWRKHDFGIAFGFILCLSVQTVVLAVLIPHFRYIASALRLIHMAGFLLAELVWLAYFVVPEPEPHRLNAQELTLVMAHYRRTLREITQ